MTTTLREKLAECDRLIGFFPVRFNVRPSVDIFLNDLENPGDDLGDADFSEWELSDLQSSEIEGCPLEGIVIKKDDQTAVILVRKWEAEAEAEVEAGIQD